MMQIKTVTVIGATGTMGSRVAGIFASFGHAKVYAVGRDIEKVKRMIPAIIQSVRADSISDHVIPADFSMLEQCAAESDLIFESAAEDMDVKTGIAQRIGRVLRENAVSCTGSSGLSVTALAEQYPDQARDRFLGVHMFNPPYSMPLCELIATRYTDRSVLTELRQYLERVLLRTVVEVKDSPAFLGNRIGFQFINRAMQYAEKYQDSGGIDYIDAILGPFTGRSMPPLVTSDFVGLDVHQAIVDNVYRNTCDYARETFVMPHFAGALVAEGKLGRKTGCGLYKKIRCDSGSSRQMVLDIRSGLYRDQIPYMFPFAEQMKKHIAQGDYREAFEALIRHHSPEAQICLDFLLQYIVYALYAAGEVSDSPEAADATMATGFKWCPPMALYQVLSDVTDVKALIRERLPSLWDQADVNALLQNVRPSKYDYRPYFKSTK